MRLIEFSHAAPAVNLALDEILLDGAEEGQSGDVLRFWESPVRFVVLGTAQALADEVHETACVQDGVPVLRRCSAGGCVLQGPGSLNFTLVLRLDDHPEVRGIGASYTWILGRLIAGFVRRGVPLRHEGVCDLTLAGRKVSGNAQRRRRRAILHHGTLLYRPDYSGMTRYLREPRDRPAYRGAQTHEAFVGHIPLDAVTIRAEVREAFGVDAGEGRPAPRELEMAMELAHAKYLDPAWIRRR